jgi:hypothetical protein
VPDYRLPTINGEGPLISKFDSEFLALLNHKNNRMIWGAMSALDAIASHNPGGIYKQLPAILNASDKGSVITKDGAMSILTKLAAVPEYSKNALTLLLGQFKTCATNQLPMYSENAVNLIPMALKKDFIKVLQSRMPEIEKESKQKRVQKVIRKLTA